MESKQIRIDEILEYENNPRINDYAIDAVVESIKQCGYISPIIVDEENVILAGHTRLKALKELGETVVDCIVISDISDEQKRKFRILDNKTAEEAEWDEELLAGELEGLDLEGIHWFDELKDYTLDAPKEEKKSETKKKDPEDDVIKCPRCGCVIENTDKELEDSVDW